VHHYVLGFDVPMKYTLTVHKIHAVADLLKKFTSALLRQSLLLFEHLLEMPVCTQFEQQVNVFLVVETSVESSYVFVLHEVL
jgi:hypothetical protein